MKEKTAFIITDLSFGDSGKGAAVDFLTADQHINQVARFSGGSQAAHHVVDPDGREHKFSQICAGAFHGAKSFLTREMLVDPILLLDEWDEFEKTLGRKYEDVYVDPDCVVITPFHVMANRKLENARGVERHGSCGLGIGQTREDFFNGFYITVGDLLNDDYKDKLQEIRELKCHQFNKVFALPPHYFRYIDEFRERIKTDKFDKEESIIFEGSQGILIDEKWGFPPYHTWTDVTARNAFVQANDFADYSVKKLGVIRSYMTRHGAGPFVTEDNSLCYPEKHNTHNTWQEGFRVGHLDLVAVKYAIECNDGIDGLVINHMDLLPKFSKVCVGYSNISRDYYDDDCILHSEGITEAMFRAKPIYDEVHRDDFRKYVEDFLGVKVYITSYGPTCTEKQIHFEL